MYLDHYKDKLLAEIHELRSRVALYESDDVIAAMKDLCEKRIRGIEGREKRNYDAWIKAVEANRDLKKENTRIRNEKATLKKAKERCQTREGQLKREVERLKQQNATVTDQRDEARKENGEKDRQIEALKEEICRLKAQIDHDGTTNGIPTSQTPAGKKKVIPNSREKSGRKRGGQEGHEKHFLRANPEEAVTETEDHGLDQCPHCGGELTELEGQAVEKDETDYEVKIIRKRHRFKEYICRECGKRVRAPIPKRLKEENQYGANIQAMVLALLDLGFISVKRTRDITIGMMDRELRLSEGFVGKVQKKAARMLKDFNEEVKAFCLVQKILYWDDTVVFMNTARACFRFYGNEKVAYYRAHESKGAEGIKDDGILANLTEKTTLMHDHVKYNYRKEFLFKNIECVQHLERELEKVSRDSQHRWASEMKELISTTIHRRKDHLRKGKKGFTDEETNRFEERMEQILTKGWSQCMKDQSRYYHTDERNCLKKFEEYRENYFAWVYDFELPTTNNLSESSLRMTKTKQKVSGQFLKVETAREFAAVRTYTETCRRNGVNEYQALQRLMAGNPYTLDEVLGHTK
ncbi:MAG: IS66 family transposase [Eubacterium sp.]|nr:IS66 family transposase [Eubacterium sp.]